jgi:TolB-like protein
MMGLRGAGVDQNTQSQVDPESIRQELDRLLSSKVFFPARRSQSFLRYVIDKSLAGNPPKEYEIAVEVLGKGADYDPAIDSTVRVEAGRLRNKLREYYDVEGAADPILITIPKGGYAAVFTPRETAQDKTAQESHEVGHSEGNGNGSFRSHESGLLETQPAETPQKTVSDASADSIVSVGHESRSFIFRHWVWLTIGVGIIAVAMTAIALRFKGRDPHRGGPIRSLAVLPLENLSGNPDQEYFADGITDELITELAHIPGLQVVSRTTVMQDKGNKKSLRQIAQELNVDAIVEGSVVRSGDRVRVTAQLIDARNDRHLWAQSYEEQMSDVLTLQDKVVREIASQTQTALVLPDNSSARIDPEAYDAYLRGLYFLHLREAHKSAGYFQQAIARDSSYAAAYAGLAEALASEAILGEATDPDTQSQAFAAAQHAIQLDPRSGEAYAALGLIEMNYSKNWSAAGRDLENSIRLSPGNPLAEMQYSIYLDAVDRPEDAVTHMRQALRLDPLSFYMNRHLGSILYLARHYDEALYYLHRAVEMEPGKHSLADNWASRSYEESGRLEEAEQSDLLHLGARIPDAKLQPLRLAWQRSGWKAYQTVKIELLAKNPLYGCDLYEMGESYLRLGDRDQAFKWINRGIDEHCYWGDMMQVDPLLDDLRNDARYSMLVQRMHF